ncbi:MAG: bifunctional hydroxymethylpyrimidine kinase/phosphomethylpyrimidine kinase [Planctomycetota bacterium]|nr:MAG: bifunctional hydroxymethylpyrimidine kinase/phosphomethylpyrimidine kinase [Planctomycetota bacterium]
MSSKRPLVPLSIAGSDPSGGAGIQADLKVFLRFGLSGAAVPTALTVQGPSGVRSIEPVGAKLVKRQLDALMTDLRPAAVKVGMLATGEMVREVARALAPLARKGIPIIVDPVLQASSGARVLPRDDVAVFMRHLAPLATLITPNVTEAAELAGTTVARVRKDTQEVIELLLRAGPKAVLIKGGHLSGDEAVDILGTREEVLLFSLPRVPRRRSVHGTGCALASAIAALMARKLPLEDAVELAKNYVAGAIVGARYVGRGSRMLDFFAPVGEDDIERLAKG